MWTERTYRYVRGPGSPWESFRPGRAPEHFCPTAKRCSAAFCDPFRTTSKGVLLIGHGTRRRHGVQEFVAFYEAVKAKLASSGQFDHHLLSYGFLELQAPSIGDAVQGLVDDGADCVIGIPLFLFEAGHMKEDIPQALARGQQNLSQIEIQLEHAFGSAGVMLTVVKDRIGELGLLSDGALAEGRNLLLLGRGNKDEAAQRAFLDVADEVRETLSLPRVYTGFLAGTGQSVEDALTRAAEDGCRSMVIFPFLWFSGWLTDTLPKRIEAWRKSYPDIEIQIAPHLGLHPSLIDHVANRVISSCFSRIF